jgi:hypothetical protein
MDCGSKEVARIEFRLNEWLHCKYVESAFGNGGYRYALTKAKGEIA